MCRFGWLSSLLTVTEFFDPAKPQKGRVRIPLLVLFQLTAPKRRGESEPGWQAVYRCLSHELSKTLSAILSHHLHLLERIWAGAFLKSEARVKVFLVPTSVSGPALSVQQHPNNRSGAFWSEFSQKKSRLGRAAGISCAPDIAVWGRGERRSRSLNGLKQALNQ